MQVEGTRIISTTHAKPFCSELVLKTWNQIRELKLTLHTNRTEHATGKTLNQAENDHEPKLGRWLDMCLMPAQLEHSRTTREADDTPFLTPLQTELFVQQLFHT